MDEEGTHVRLKEHLRVLIDPKVTAYRGHIVKNTGDGFLAEFNSVVDAMRCAIDVQRGTLGPAVSRSQKCQQTTFASQQPHKILTRSLCQHE
jgi:class 3 adenylate cyclase